jgi:hypothetical protein
MHPTTSSSVKRVTHSHGATSQPLPCHRIRQYLQYHCRPVRSNNSSIALPDLQIGTEIANADSSVTGTTATISDSSFCNSRLGAGGAYKMCPVFVHFLPALWAPLPTTTIHSSSAGPMSLLPEMDQGSRRQRASPTTMFPGNDLL